jgi:hypothetical protein
LLQKEEDWREDSVALREESLAIISKVVAQYRRQDDLLSAAALAEGTCSALERELGPTHPSLQQLSSTAQTMFYVLEQPEKDAVRSL